MMVWNGLENTATATKHATHLLKTLQKYCACRTRRLSTRYQTRLNVTKCHACHAKRSNAICETSKSLQNLSRHGHTRLARTVADGCGRLRAVANGCERLRMVANGCERLRAVANVHKRNDERTHPQPPDPQSEMGTLATHSGK